MQTVPGKGGRQFRQQLFHEVCRLIGGDMRLVADIETRNELLKSTDQGRKIQESLLRPPSTWVVEVTRRKREGAVRDELALRLGGKTEVSTPVGF